MNSLPAMEFFVLAFETFNAFAFADKFKKIYNKFLN